MKKRKLRKTIKEVLIIYIFSGCGLMAMVSDFDINATPIIIVYLLSLFGCFWLLKEYGDLDD